MADDVFETSLIPLQARKSTGFESNLDKVSIADVVVVDTSKLEPKSYENNAEKTSEIQHTSESSSSKDNICISNSPFTVDDQFPTKTSPTNNVESVDDNVERNSADSALTSLQDSSDIRFFICGTCKNNPILIGAIPKLLPCLHSFCDKCLQDKYEKQKTVEDNGSPRLKCPACGQEFLVSCNDGCPMSGFLNNQFVIESTQHSSTKKMSTSDTHECTSCDDKSIAQSYCVNCSEWLCDTCVSAHQRVKVTKDHVIQENADALPVAGHNNQVDGNSKEKPLYCKVHPSEQLKLFCANCDKLTCRDCQLVEHKDHRYQFIDEAATKHREILKKLLQYLQINLGLLKETISEVEKMSLGLSDQGLDLEKEIEKAFDCLVDSIRTRKNTILKELSLLVTNKKNLLAKQKKDLTQMKIILEHNHDFADFAVKGGSNVALLYSRKVLGTRLHNLNSLKYRQRPLAVTDLKFSMDVDKLCSYFNKIGAVYSHEDMQRKIDHYNNKNPNGIPKTSNARSFQLRMSSSQNPIDSMTAMNKRITDNSANSSNSAGFINLCKQNTLGIPTQNVRTAVSPHHVSSRTLSNSKQDMIVLSSSASPKYNSDMINKQDYTAKYLDQLNDPVIRGQPNPRTPVTNEKTYYIQNRNFQNKDSLRTSTNNFSSVNKFQSQNHSPNWNKLAHGSSSGKSNTIEQLRKMVEGSSSPQANNTLSFSTDHITNSKPNDSETGTSNRQASHMIADAVPVKEEKLSPQTHMSHASHIDDQRSESGFDEGQNNEDYCGVCRNGGQLLCCDTCPKVYHLHCHIPVMTDLPSDSWSCGLCVEMPQESKHVIGSKRRYTEQISDYEVKVCEKMLLNLFVHSDSVPFHQKVSKIQVPDYYKVITKPMDMSTVLTKLNPSHFYHYKTFEDFISDIRLIFSNCFIYNSAESEVCKMGRRLEAYFDTLLQKYAPDANPYPDSDCRKRRKDEGLARILEKGT